MTDTSIFGTEASKQLPSGASNGQIPIWNSSTNRWEAGANGGFDPTANITFSGGVAFTNSVTVDSTNFNLFDGVNTVKFNIGNIILNSAVAYFPTNWNTNIFAATDLNNNFSVAQTFAQNINATKALVMAASAGNGYIQMGRQSASPSGVASNLSIFADASNRLSFREGTGSIATFSNTNLGSNAVFSFPNVSSGTLATIDNAQTFTATQTFSVDTLITNTKKITNALDASQSIHFTGNLTFNDASKLTFNIGGTARANLTSTGFAIGITDTTASTRLHVRGDGTNNIARFEDSAGTASFRINSTATNAILSGSSSPGYQVTSSAGANNSLTFGLGNSGGRAEFAMGSALTNFAILNGSGFTGLSMVNGTGERNAIIIGNNGVNSTSGTSRLVVQDSIAETTGSTNFRTLNLAYSINNSGSVSGTATGIFLNATEGTVSPTSGLNGMGHFLIDLQVGGSSKFKVSNGGLVNTVTMAAQNSACSRYSDPNSGGINWASVNSTTAAVVYQTTGLYSALTTDVINTCAVFELRSTTKGFLLPRMTTAQRDLIASPVAGLLIYNTTTNGIEVYTTSWTGFSVIGGGTGLGGT